MPKPHRCVLESGPKPRVNNGMNGCSGPLNAQPLCLVAVANVSRELGLITFLGQLTTVLARKGLKQWNMFLCRRSKHPRANICPGPPRLPYCLPLEMGLKNSWCLGDKMGGAAFCFGVPHGPGWPLNHCVANDDLELLFKKTYWWG